MSTNPDYPWGNFGNPLKTRSTLTKSDLELLIDILYARLKSFHMKHPVDIGRFIVNNSSRYWTYFTNLWTSFQV
jgi:hypothetical protein